MKFKALKLTVCLLLMTAVFAFAQNGIEKTLVKSFNPKGKQVVVLDLDGDVEVVTWKNTILRFQMTIQLEQGSNAMLKSLIKAGRYNLDSSEKSEDWMISTPQMKKEIRVSGKLLKERITYIVYAPENVTVKLANEASVQAVTGESALAPSL